MEAFCYSPGLRHTLVAHLVGGSSQLCATPHFLSLWGSTKSVKWSLSNLSVFDSLSFCTCSIASHQEVNGMEAVSNVLGLIIHLFIHRGQFL